MKAYKAAQIEASPEKMRACKAAYRKANIEKVRAYDAAYKKANPEARRAMSRNRKARKRNAIGTHTAADILNLFNLQKYKCACCKVSIKDGYHVDHNMPLARGGSNDRLNLRLLCPTCNLQKSAKHPVKFMQERGYLL